MIAFLSRMIGWYRHISVEERLVTDPAEMLFVADDRQMADQVLNLSFEYAKAQAALLAAASGAATPVRANTDADEYIRQRDRC